VNTGLSVTPAASAGFGVPLLLVDHADIPADARYRIVTRTSYVTDLTAASPAALWCQTLWSQNYNAAVAYIGRWVSADIAPRFVIGSFKQVIPTWAGVTVGDFAITDGSSTEQFSTGTMAAVTDIDDVLAKIQTEIRTSSTFAAYLSAATVTLDALGRIQVVGALAGADEDSFSIIAPTGGAGTNITGANYLNIATNAFAVAGMDAEGMEDALSAVLEKTQVPMIVCERGGDTDDQVALATAVIVQRKVAVLCLRDPDIKLTATTTDTASQLKSLSNNNVLLEYTEHAAQAPDAATIGEVATRSEGSCNYAVTPLTSVAESGLGLDGITAIPLTPGERAVLDTKGCDYLVKPANAVHLRRGLCPGGAEFRLRIAYYWADVRSSEAIYAYLLANPVTTFSDSDISAIGGLITQWWDILVQRKAVEPGFVLSLPSASSISSTIKATHTLTLSDVAALISQLAVNDVSVTASATV
jgi:hypothetical protein